MDTRVSTDCTRSHPPCVICGARIDDWANGIVLYDNDTRIGEVCRACVRAGPSGAAERMKRTAAFYRDRAAEMESMAGEVAGATAWATEQELDLVAFPDLAPAKGGPR